MRTRVNPAFAWLLPLLVLLALLPRSTVAAPPSPNLLLELAGTVEVLSASTNVWTAGRTNQVLLPGDQVRLGDRSRATVKLSNLTLIRLGPGAHIRIPETNKSWFDHFKGLLYFFHRDEPETFPVRTPSAYAVVLGTEFNLEVLADGTTRLTMLDGRVTLTNHLDNIQLSSGESALVVSNQPPKKTALLESRNVIQWCLYYPGVLHLEDLELPPDETEALAASLTAYTQGDLLTALARYPKDRPPVSNDEKIYLSSLLLSVGQVEEAERQLASLSLTPADADRDRAARLAGALRRLIHAVVLGSSASVPAPEFSTPTATEWLGESYEWQSRQALEKALWAARQAVAQAPTFAFGWARVAELEFGFGRLSEAQEALSVSLRLAPRNAQAVSLQGFLAAARNETRSALSYFDQAIALDGGLGNAWLGRGLCKIQRGRAEEGREDLQMAATVEPQRAVLRSYLGKAFSQSGDEVRAGQELDLARRLDPMDPTAWLYGALLNQQRNRINEAIRDLEHSQTLNDNRAVYRSGLLLDQDEATRGANLATIFGDAGMTEISRWEAVRAVNADYANYSSHLFLANTYNALRDPNQINLRYETPWLSEYLIANLLAPVGAGTLSQAVSQEEYSRLFERNRLGVVSSTEYSSQGDWRQGGAQFGRYDNTAYALDAVYRSRHGQRPNNDLDQVALSLQLKQQWTPQDSIFVQAGYYNAEGGQLAPVYNPDDPSMINRGLRTEERQEPLLWAGYHHEWSPGHHTLLLAGRLQDEVLVKNPQQLTLTLGHDTAGMVTDVIPTTVGQHYKTEAELYTAELQQIAQLKPHTLILGGRYQNGGFETHNDQDQATLHSSHPFNGFWESQINRLPQQQVSPEMERASVYLYDYWEVVPALTLSAGVSYDWMSFPDNFRYAPVTSGQSSEDQVSPKVGALWRPGNSTVIRGGYGQSLGGVSFDHSFQLEPSQVAGFNQAWRSLIPEAIAGANTGENFENAGVSWEQRIGRSTYLGMSGEWLGSETDRSLGVFDIDNDTLGLTRGQTAEHLRFRERSLTASLHQLLGDDWSVGARYRFSQAELHDRFPEILASSENVALNGNFQPRQHWESVLHTVHLFARFTHPSGFFAGAESWWFQQSNQGYAPDRPGDDFWQFNLFAGYRFFDRRAEVRVGLLNLTDQDYRLNPLNVTSELPRDRTLAASFRFQF